MITNYALTYPPIKTKLTSHSNNTHTLEVTPLLPGYGHTLGNALRRVFLSSIPGFAVTKIRINDITHEYQALKGVVEDAMDVVLNLKLLRARILTDDDAVTLTLKAKQAGDITAADFEKNSKVEIINTDLYIAHLNEGAELTIEVDISRGHGYLPIDEINLAATTNPLDIVVDAVYSPVSNVAFEVEKVRVGDKTNFDKVIIHFETDGTVSAPDAAFFAVKTVSDLFLNILSSFQTSLDLQEYEPHKLVVEKDVVTTNQIDTVSEVGVDSIDLPPRVKSALEKHGITTNADLKNRASEIETLPGIGATTLSKIQDYLKTIS